MNSLNIPPSASAVQQNNNHNGTVDVSFDTVVAIHHDEDTAKTNNNNTNITNKSTAMTTSSKTRKQTTLMFPTSSPSPPAQRKKQKPSKKHQQATAAVFVDPKTLIAKNAHDVIENVLTKLGIVTNNPSCLRNPFSPSSSSSNHQIRPSEVTTTTTSNSPILPTSKNEKKSFATAMTTTMNTTTKTAVAQHSMRTGGDEKELPKSTTILPAMNNIRPSSDPSPTKSMPPQILDAENDGAVTKPKISPPPPEQDANTTHHRRPVLFAASSSHLQSQKNRNSNVFVPSVFDTHPYFSHRKKFVIDSLRNHHDSSLLVAALRPPPHRQHLFRSSGIRQLQQQQSYSQPVSPTTGIDSKQPHFPRVAASSNSPTISTRSRQHQERERRKVDMREPTSGSTNQEPNTNHSGAASSRPTSPQPQLSAKRTSFIIPETTSTAAVPQPRRGRSYSGTSTNAATSGRGRSGGGTPSNIFVPAEVLQQPSSPQQLPPPLASIRKTLFGRIGQLKFLKRLGGGSFGQVFLCAWSPDNNNSDSTAEPLNRFFFKPDNDDDESDITSTLDTDDDDDEEEVFEEDIRGLEEERSFNKKHSTTTKLLTSMIMKGQKKKKKKNKFTQQHLTQYEQDSLIAKDLNSIYEHVSATWNCITPSGGCCSFFSTKPLIRVIYKNSNAPTNSATGNNNNNNNNNNSNNNKIAPNFSQQQQPNPATVSEIYPREFIFVCKVEKMPEEFIQEEKRVIEAFSKSGGVRHEFVGSCLGRVSSLKEDDDDEIEVGRRRFRQRIRRGSISTTSRSPIPSSPHKNQQQQRTDRTQSSSRFSRQPLATPTDLKHHSHHLSAQNNTNCAVSKCLPLLPGAVATHYYYYLGNGEQQESAEVNQRMNLVLPQISSPSSPTSASQAYHNDDHGEEENQQKLLLHQSRLTANSYRTVEEQTKSRLSYAVGLAALTRMRREAHILSNIAHPNILSFIDCFSTDQELEKITTANTKNNNNNPSPSPPSSSSIHQLLLLEYVDGTDLEQEVSRLRKTNLFYSESSALCLFVQIVMAVEYLHRHNIIHRDIKLSNILLSDHHLIKLSDFGTSEKFLMDTDLLIDVSLKGSAYYLSPEIFIGVPYSEKTDMYSLGVVLYRLLDPSGYPFTGHDLRSLAHNVLNGEVRPLHRNSLSPELADLLSALLDRDPDYRPTALQVLQRPEMQAAMNTYLFRTELLLSKSLKRKMDREKEIARLKKEIERLTLQEEKEIRQEIQLLKSQLCMKNNSQSKTKYEYDVTTSNCYRRNKQVKILHSAAVEGGKEISNASTTPANNSSTATNFNMISVPVSRQISSYGDDFFDGSTNQHYQQQQQNHNKTDDKNAILPLNPSNQDLDFYYGSGDAAGGAAAATADIGDNKVINNSNKLDHKDDDDDDDDDEEDDVRFNQEDRNNNAFLLAKQQEEGWNKEESDDDDDEEHLVNYMKKCRRRQLRKLEKQHHPFNMTVNASSNTNSCSNSRSKPSVVVPLNDSYQIGGKARNDKIVRLVRKGASVSKNQNDDNVENVSSPPTPTPTSPAPSLPTTELLQIAKRNLSKVSCQYSSFKLDQLTYDMLVEHKKLVLDSMETRAKSQTSQRSSSRRRVDEVKHNHQKRQKHQQQRSASTSQRIIATPTIFDSVMKRKTLNRCTSSATTPTKRESPVPLQQKLGALPQIDCDVCESPLSIVSSPPLYTPAAGKNKNPSNNINHYNLTESGNTTKNNATSDKNITTNDVKKTESYSNNNQLLNVSAYTTSLKEGVNNNNNTTSNLLQNQQQQQALPVLNTSNNNVFTSANNNNTKTANFTTTESLNPSMMICITKKEQPQVETVSENFVKKKPEERREELMNLLFPSLAPSSKKKKKNHNNKKEEMTKPLK